MSNFIQTNNEAIAEYSDEKRLKVFNMLTSACTHLYSKGKLQENKFNEVSILFADLAKNDPIFMAHFAAWASKKDSKDMKLLSIFFNSLNDADGTPFFKGAKKNKPNLREVSYALLQEVDPHLASRILELCHKRFSIPGIFNDSRHFSTGMKNAYKKYLGYREENPDMLRGIRRAGLGKKIEHIYRFTHTSPSTEAASILNWKQKDGRNIAMENLPDFASKSSEEIVEILSSKKISPIVAISMIPHDKITSSVAKGLLNNCSGNQSIILYRWFAKNGFLDVSSIKNLFKDKVKEASTAIDRIETLTKDADASDKKEMSQIRSEKRKKDVGANKFGKIYLHIDISSSMNQAIDFAKDRACIIAECVDSPDKNFGWGTFNQMGTNLPIPDSFTKEDFHQALYGVRATGSTDCIALYEKARRFGAEIDVYVTDQGHNVGSISTRINNFHINNPNISKPKAAVIVDYSYSRNARIVNQLESSLKSTGIPVAIINPESLKESALVAQSVRAALIGEMAIVNEIMETPLPKLPKWWNSINK